MYLRSYIKDNKKRLRIQTNWTIEKNDHFEIDTPVCAALPGRTGVPYVDDLLPGEALATKTAKLQVGDIVQQKAVGENDPCVTFQLSLKKGSTRVQTYFDDGIDVPPGAYYVYVKKITNILSDRLDCG